MNPPELMRWAPLINELLLPVIVSMMTAVATYVALRVTGLRSRRTSSLFYLIPLAAPLLVYAAKPPILYFGGDRILATVFENSQLTIYVLEAERTLNIAAAVVYACLATAAVLFVVLKVAGPGIVCFLLNVEPAQRETYSALYDAVEATARKAGIPAPLVGVIDSIEPNAFTVGEERRAKIVVTTGLLRILDGDEVKAVVAHEVAHIKSLDYRLSTVVCCLRTAMFMNPVAHLAASKILRDREHLADAVSAEIHGGPETLGLALVKIWEATRSNKPARSSLITGILGISNLRSNALSLHPNLEKRLETLLEPPETGATRGKVIAAGFIILVLCGAMTGALAGAGVLPSARRMIHRAPGGGAFFFEVKVGEAFSGMPPHPRFPAPMTWAWAPF